MSFFCQKMPWRLGSFPIPIGSQRIPWRKTNPQGRQPIGEKITVSVPKQEPQNTLRSSVIHIYIYICTPGTWKEGARSFHAFPFPRHFCWSSLLTLNFYVLCWVTQLHVLQFLLQNRGVPRNGTFAAPNICPKENAAKKNSKKNGKPNENRQSARLWFVCCSLLKAVVIPLRCLEKFPTFSDSNPCESSLRITNLPPLTFREPAGSVWWVKIVCSWNQPYQHIRLSKDPSTFPKRKTGFAILGGLLSEDIETSICWRNIMVLKYIPPANLWQSKRWMHPSFKHTRGWRFPMFRFKTYHIYCRRKTCLANPRNL